MTNLLIDYYSKTEASVRTCWPEEVPNQSIQHLDSLLFACYLIRQMRNLGSHPSNIALQEQILNWIPSTSSNLETQLGWTVYPEVSYDSHIIFHAALSIGMETSYAKSKYGQEIQLVSYRGKGEKCFTGTLSEYKSRPMFILNVKGFGIGGLLGLNIPMYATDSVFHLIAHLCKKYPNDGGYPTLLIRIAQGCVEAFKTNKITSINQEAFAYNIVKALWSMKM